MSGDALKKVQPGDDARAPPARAYNAFIDAARAHRESGQGFGRTPTRPSGRTCIVAAQNVSGEAAPMHAPCSLVGEVSGSAGILRFDKAEDPPYGILLEPIASGGVGRVAVAGGEYKVLCAGEAAVGDLLLPVSGQWEVEEGYGPFVAMTAPAEGTCWAVFAAVGGIEIRDDDPPADELWEGRVWFNTSVV